MNYIINVLTHLLVTHLHEQKLLEESMFLHFSEWTLEDITTGIFFYSSEIHLLLPNQ